MSTSRLTRTITEPFTYADGNLVGQSVANSHSWEVVYTGLTSLTISSGTAQTSLTQSTGAALRSANLPNRWAKGFTVSFNLKTDSLTVGHNHFNLTFGAYAAPASQYVVIFFNSRDVTATDYDTLDNIHVSSPGAAPFDQYTYSIPFTQNVSHQVVVTFVPSSATSTQGVLTVTIDGVVASSNTVDFVGVTDGIMLIEGIFNTTSRWTVDNLVVTSTYPAGRTTTGGVAVFPQGAGGYDRVLGYRTYNAPSTLTPTNHTATFDLGTLVDNLTLANPADDGSGFVEGQKLEVLLKTSTGGMTLSFGTSYKFGQGSASAQAIADVIALGSQNARILFEYDSALAAYICTRLLWGF